MEIHLADLLYPKEERDTEKSHFLEGFLFYTMGLTILLNPSKKNTLKKGFITFQEQLAHYKILHIFCCC